MAKVLSCFNACAVGDGATAGHSGASPAASADELPIASLTELAPIYTLEGEVAVAVAVGGVDVACGCMRWRGSCAKRNHAIP